MFFLQLKFEKKNTATLLNVANQGKLQVLVFNVVCGVEARLSR